MEEKYNKETSWCVAPYHQNLRISERAFLLVEEFFARYGNKELDLTEVPSNATPLGLDIKKDYKELAIKLWNKDLSYDEAVLLYVSFREDQRSYRESWEQVQFKEELLRASDYTCFFQMTQLTDQMQALAEDNLFKDELSSLADLALALNDEMEKYGYGLNPNQIEKYTGVNRKRYSEILNIEAVPAKGTIYSLAFFFHLSLETTREWLRMAGYTSFNTIADRVFEESFNNAERGFASFCIACKAVQQDYRNMHPKVPKKLSELDGIINTTKTDYTDDTVVDFLENCGADPRDYGFEPNKRIYHSISK